MTTLAIVAIIIASILIIALIDIARQIPSFRLGEDPTDECDDEKKRVRKKVSRVSKK